MNEDAGRRAAGKLNEQAEARGHGGDVWIELAIALAEALGGGGGLEVVAGWPDSCSGRQQGAGLGWSAVEWSQSGVKDRSCRVAVRFSRSISLLQCKAGFYVGGGGGVAWWWGCSTMDDPCHAMPRRGEGGWEGEARCAE